eukprot:comp14344_c1_seq1/m.10400 comp14344_c1_seq1/g.10400  ORF comp14344_c1_seq1/g.10400 comp14344_c1_seq1/m.10400 type:complete len:125 (-) comp14344_c1_seq1:138-512(-)
MNVKPLGWRTKVKVTEDDGSEKVKSVMLYEALVHREGKDGKVRKVADAKQFFCTDLEAARHSDRSALALWVTRALKAANSKSKSKGLLLPFPPTNFDPATYDDVNGLIVKAIRQRERLLADTSK